ncbi:MAG: multicopper oxidase family protein [Rhodobacter sp.]|nr:multicopper oxidase family protein [Rhodobacter sp.]
MPTRRAFLTGTAAALAARPSLAAVSETTVTAAPAMAQIVPAEYGPTEVWAYDGAVPGAGLRVAQGTRIRRRFVNRLPQASTIHWHGIRIDNAMDGVAGLTQDAVPPGGEFLYDFVVPDAGTYWYHPHSNTLEQLSRGLTAPLIVEEAEPPEVDRDIALTINDWRLDENAQIAGGFGNMRDGSHAGRLGNYLTANGEGDPQWDAARNERLRLRLINAASARVLRLSALGLSGHVVALDGMPLAVPEPFADLVLGPAQRADLILDVTAEAGEPAYLVSEERDGGYALATFNVTGTASAVARPAPAALPPNRLEPLELSGARAVDLRMEGGAMGGLAEARIGMRHDGGHGGHMGGPVGMRELVENGFAWALNGVAGMPEAPLVEAARGETVRVKLVNDTAWPHAMHLHGHHFHVVGEAGTGPARDTVLMDRGQTVEIAFVADNPGSWMFHCHMLAHQAAGMMTWVRVAES